MANRRERIEGTRMMLAASRRSWWYEAERNGIFVTIHAPDGRTAFLQGDSAQDFMERAERTNERYTDADLCREYGDVLA